MIFLLKLVKIKNPQKEILQSVMFLQITFKGRHVSQENTYNLLLEFFAVCKFRKYKKV